LLGDGAGAPVIPFEPVAESREQPFEVDAEVRIKMLVFCGYQSFDQHGRQLAEINGRAVLLEKPAYHLPIGAEYLRGDALLRVPDIGYARRPAEQPQEIDVHK